MQLKNAPLIGCGRRAFWMLRCHHIC
jgi:hypothetical protein